MSVWPVLKIAIPRFTFIFSNSLPFNCALCKTLSLKYYTSKAASEIKNASTKDDEKIILQRPRRLAAPALAGASTSAAGGHRTGAADPSSLLRRERQVSDGSWGRCRAPARQGPNRRSLRLRPCSPRQELYTQSGSTLSPLLEVVNCSGIRFLFWMRSLGFQSSVLSKFLVRSL